MRASALRDGALRTLRDGALRTLRDGALRTLRDGALRTLRDGALRTLCSSTPPITPMMFSKLSSVTDGCIPLILP
jgi:hypothetical protein